MTGCRVPAPSCRKPSLGPPSPHRSQPGSFKAGTVPGTGARGPHPHTCWDPSCRHPNPSTFLTSAPTLDPNGPPAPFTPSNLAPNSSQRVLLKPEAALLLPCLKLSGASHGAPDKMHPPRESSHRGPHPISSCLPLPSHLCSPGSSHSDLPLGPQVP